MSKVLKAATVRIDEYNRVSVDVLDIAALNEIQELRRIETESVFDDDFLSPEDEARVIIETASKEAAEMIRSASEEAEYLIEKRRAEFEDELADLREETLKEAFDRGYECGYEESNGVRERADTILKDAFAEHDETLKNMEPEVAGLICKIVRKLTADTAELKPELIACLIKQGLDEANAPGDVAVHVSAHDYDEVVKHKTEFMARVDTGYRVDVVKDPSLKKSDCIIETPYGNIDCSLEQQFASLTDSVFYIMNNR